MCEELIQLKIRFSENLWFLAGDFNSMEYENFINNMEVEDIPNVDSKFMW